MIVIDQITIIICVVLILLAIISPLFNPFFRARSLFAKNKEEKEEEETRSSDQYPPITVLITAHENAEELERHLPTLLSLDYPGAFEIVVVAEKGDGETEDVLKRYINNRHLYYTFIPNSSRYMSRKKLAITLGVKASRYEWIIMTDANSTPSSDEWLKTMAKDLNDNTNMVIGYSNYGKDAPSYYRFEQLRTACYLLQKARQSVAFRTNCTNVIFRKSEFINRDGYRGNLQLVRGEFDFLVNKFAKKHDTIVETSSKTWMTDELPTRKAWRDKHIFYMETRKHLARRHAFRFVFNLDTFLLHLNFLAIIAALAYSIIVQNWIITAVAALSLIYSIYIRTAFAKRVFRRSDTQISLWKVIPYELVDVWYNIRHYIRYLKADKNDFSSHKV